MPALDSTAWSLGSDGVRLAVRLSPNSGRDAVDGLATQSDSSPVLKVRVRAVPEDGKANAALIEILAIATGLPRSSIALEGGGKSRNKLIRISGDPAGIDAVLRRIVKV